MGFVLTSDGQSLVLGVLSFPELLVGIVVTPGYAIVDTGAQHGVVVEKDCEELCVRFQTFGLKLVELFTFSAVATGVG